MWLFMMGACLLPVIDGCSGPHPFPNYDPGIGPFLRLFPHVHLIPDFFMFYGHTPQGLPFCVFRPPTPPPSAFLPSSNHNKVPFARSQEPG